MPPFANSMLACWVSTRLICFEASLHGLSKTGGWGEGVGGAAPPITSLHGLKNRGGKTGVVGEGGGGGGGGPHDGLQKDSYAASLRGLKQRGGGGEHMSLSRILDFSILALRLPVVQGELERSPASCLHLINASRIPCAPA